MPISNEQWEAIEKELFGSYGTVKLRYKEKELHLTKVLVSENQLATVVYIDGSYKLAWGHPDMDESFDPLTKDVWHKRSRSAFTEKQKKQYLKIWGKRELKKRGIDLEKKQIWYEPVFNKFNPLKTQYKKLEGLEVISIGHHSKVA